MSASDVDIAIALSLTADVPSEVDIAHQEDWERYRRDIVAWVNECCYTFDPRMNDQKEVIGWVPFHTYDFQADYLRWKEERYIEREDSFTEKSRDMGVTWCEVAWLVHHWLFDDSFQALAGSYTEKMTDNFLPDSIFGKIEGLIDHLPGWQQSRAGWSSGSDDCRKHLTVRNKSNGNTISGQSANPRFGRGGRYSAIFIDEFSQWDFAEQVLASSRAASPYRSFVATPLGMNTSGRLRHSGHVKVMTLHWRLHPNKDDAWYENECRHNTPEHIAQELDISYERSVVGRVLPEWDHVASGEFPFVVGWPTYVSWDFGLDDHTALVWWQRNPNTGMYRVVDCYSSTGKTIKFYVPFITGEVASGLPYEYTEEDLEKIGSHRGWGDAVHYGDPAGAQRNQVTGSSVIMEMAKEGIYVNTRPDRNTFHERWQTTKLFLRQIEGWHRETCLPLHDAIINSRFPARDPDSQHTSEITKPIHNWASHYRTSVEYAAVNLYGKEERGMLLAPTSQPSAFMLRSGYNAMDGVRKALRSRR